MIYQGIQSEIVISYLHGRKLISLYNMQSSNLLAGVL